jgi:hypothetical protein
MSKPSKLVAFQGLVDLPWEEAFSRINDFPEPDILKAFEYLLFETSGAEFAGFEYRSLVTLALENRRVLIGFTLGTEADVIVDLANETVSLRSESDFLSIKSTNSLFIALLRIRGALLMSVKGHVHDNIKLAVDVFKLAASQKLYDVVPVRDLDILVRYFSKVARMKAGTSLARTRTKALIKSTESDSVIAKPVRAKPAAKPKTSKTFKGIRWHEAASNDPGTGSGFILTEQEDKTWLVTYNGKLALAAFSEEAAKELVDDVIADPKRLKEFQQHNGAVIRDATVIRLQK